MKSYNGFSPMERQATWNIQKYLRAKGDMTWDGGYCEMCLNISEVIVPHLENYFEYRDFHSLCISCHMFLHLRFSRPMAWVKYLNMLLTGWQPPVFNDTKAYFKSDLNKELSTKLKYIGPLYSSEKWFHQLSTKLSETEKIREQLIYEFGYDENLIPITSKKFFI